MRPPNGCADKRAVETEKNDFPDDVVNLFDDVGGRGAGYYFADGMDQKDWKKGQAQCQVQVECQSEKHTRQQGVTHQK